MDNNMVVDDVGAAIRTFGWADYVVFISMLVVCSCVGTYWGFAKDQDTQDYLMGGRNMKIFPVAVSLVASYISGISILGTPTEMYVYGMQYMYIFGGAILMAVILSYIFLPVYHELKILSSYEYLQRRFDRRIRLFGSVLFTISLITWLPIVIYVPALAFNQVTGINVHIITPIVCVVCIFYTCVGGLQAVVWTDVIQTIMMFGAMIIVIIKGTIDVGGISIVWQRNWDSGRIEAPNFDINPSARHTVWSLVIGGCFFWLVNNAVSQTMVQRYMSLPNIQSAKKAAVYFIVGVLSLIFLCCYSGLLIYATYYNCDPLTTQLAKAKDQLLPLFVMDIMGSFPGLPGLFVAGVFSAALSSLSTGLNSMAAVVLEDFYKPFSKKPLTEKQTEILMKTVVVVLGVICLSLVFIVEKLGTVLQLTMSLGAITNGASLGMCASGLLLARVHSDGALIGGITSLIVMGWICLSAQTAIARGDLYFQEKPVSTSECQYSFTPLQSRSFVVTAQNSTGDIKHTDEMFMLYRLSYMWYTVLGTLISMIVSYLVSISWKRVDLRKIDVSLLTPCLRKYYKTTPVKKLLPQNEKEAIKLDINNTDST